MVLAAVFAAATGSLVAVFLMILKCCACGNREDSNSKNTQKSKPVIQVLTQSTHELKRPSLLEPIKEESDKIENAEETSSQSSSWNWDESPSEPGDFIEDIMKPIMNSSTESNFVMVDDTDLVSDSEVPGPSDDVEWLDN